MPDTRELRHRFTCWRIVGDIKPAFVPRGEVHQVFCNGKLSDRLMGEPDAEARRRLEDFWNEFITGRDLDQVRLIYSAIGRFLRRQKKAAPQGTKKCKNNSTSPRRS